MKIADMDINFDENYQQVKSMPDDPKDSIPFMARTENADCFVMFFPIPQEQAMPFTDCTPVINGIHECLGNDQGLIEVENGKTKSGLSYIQSIVKTVDKEHPGVSYCLTLHIQFPDKVLGIQGFFNESGTTGIRDTMVYAALSESGKVKATEDGIEGWNKDPYDENFTRGALKNCSEDKDFDQFFPAHPLSECRRIIKYILENN